MLRQLISDAKAARQSLDWAAVVIGKTGANHAKGRERMMMTAMPPWI